MEKEKLSILVIDRPLRPGEKARTCIFEPFLCTESSTIDLVIFPPKDEESAIQLIWGFYPFTEILRELVEFDMSQIYEEQDFYDTDIYEIDLDVFYDIVNQRYEITLHDFSKLSS